MCFISESSEGMLSSIRVGCRETSRVHDIEGSHHVPLDYLHDLCSASGRTCSMPDRTGGRIGHEFEHTPLDEVNCKATNAGLGFCTGQKHNCVFFTRGSIAQWIIGGNLPGPKPRAPQGKEGDPKAWRTDRGLKPKKTHQRTAADGQTMSKYAFIFVHETILWPWSFWHLASTTRWRTKATPLLLPEATPLATMMI